VSGLVCGIFLFLEILGLPENDVTPGGPADSAGLKLRDIVLAIDGRPILGLPG
jgi:C-terminal processing protease CtpA/Prc